MNELSISATTKPKVVFARDTRASGSRLVAALVAALEATDTDYTDYKLLTTPQLHYVTRCLSTKGSDYAYGEPTEQGYYEKLAAAFQTAMKGKTFTGGVTVDCANGVGGPKLNEFLKYLPKASEGGLDIKVVNDDVLKPDRLNHQVSHPTSPPPHTTNIPVRRRLRQNRATRPALLRSRQARALLLPRRRRRPASLLLHQRRQLLPAPGR